MYRMIAAMVLSVGFAAGASAHTDLASSMPVDKAVLSAAPDEVMLHFSQPVRLTALTIQRSGEERQPLGPLPRAASKDFAVSVPRLGSGEYVVGWRALAEDTHVMSGQFTFTLRGADSHADHAAH